MALRAIALFCSVLVQIQVFSQVSTQSEPTTIASALGELCTETSNCTHTANTDCIAGVCSCLDTHTSNGDNNKCYPLTPQLGAPCDIGPQCSNFGDGAICSNGTCSCQDGFRSAGAVCLFVIDKLWKPCDSHRQVCYLEANGDYQNVYCNSLCYCNPGFTESSDLRRCMGYVGTTCVVNSTCPENAECVDSQCRCNSESVKIGSTCKAVLGAGEECGVYDFCTDNSYCTNSICKCNAGHKQDGRFCVPGSGAETIVSTLCMLLAAIISLGQHHWI